MKAEGVFETDVPCPSCRQHLVIGITEVSPGGARRDTLYLCRHHGCGWTGRMLTDPEGLRQGDDRGPDYYRPCDCGAAQVRALWATRTTDDGIVHTARGCEHVSTWQDG